MTRLSELQLKDQLLKDLADAYRTDPDASATYGTLREANALGVSLEVLGEVVSELQKEGLIRRRDFDAKWTITGAGLDRVDSDDPAGDSERALKARVDDLEKRVRALEKRG